MNCKSLHIQFEFIDMSCFDMWFKKLGIAWHGGICLLPQYLGTRGRKISIDPRPAWSPKEEVEEDEDEDEEQEKKGEKKMIKKGL